MTTTTHSKFPLLSDQQSQQDTVANESFAMIDEALAGITTIASSGATVTLTDSQALSKVYRVTGTSTATIVAPDRQKVALVMNDSTQAIDVKTVTGAAVSVAAGARKWLVVLGASGAFELI